MIATSSKLSRVWWVPTFFKVGYLLSILVALLLCPDMDFSEFFKVMARWPREGQPIFASHFATWDAAHYLYLSEVGYHAGVPSCAFYPLWPLLVCGSAPLLGGSHVLTGLVLANAFSLAAWVLFHRLVARRWGESAANWTLAFLIAFPGALFFQFNYTESLFLLLVLLLWWGLEEQRLGWAWVAACLLPLTRGVGVFAVLPIGWYLLMKRPFGWMSRWRWVQTERGIHSASDPGAIGDIPTERRNEFRASFDCGLAAVREYALLLAPLFGWGLYLALMWHWTGNPFEGFQAQKHWGVHSISNLWNVPKFVVGFFTPTEWHAFRGSMLDRLAFLPLLYGLPVLWRLDKGLLVWAYMLSILPAMSGTFTSFTRFASCAFPMFIALGVFLGRREWRWPRYVLLTVFVTLHVVLVWRFVNFRWAG